MEAASALRRAFDTSRSLSKATEARLRLPSDKPLWQRFERTAADIIRALPDGATVVDLGGGRRCVYAWAVQPGQNLRLVAVDISPEELAANTDVAETRVANVADDLPFPDASVDLILSRALLEHVDGVPAAARNMARVLRPGGVSLHLIPGRYSLFATAARVLPFGPLLRVLHVVRPETRGQVEFDVHYDHCHPDALRQVFEAAGFSRVTVDYCWAQPGYFEEIYPLFLLHALYERAVRKLGLRRLASYMVVRAER
jgi:ubiquinone/menaquinone biosynthesis C-methylase UbiE